MIKACKDNEINGAHNWQNDSELDDYIFDFSMGDVLFSSRCKFDKKSSEKFVNILLEKIQEERRGWWEIFN